MVKGWDWEPSMQPTDPTAPPSPELQPPAAAVTVDSAATSGYVSSDNVIRAIFSFGQHALVETKIKVPKEDECQEMMVLKVPS